MLCLDTYALVEIGLNNPKYSNILNERFVIPDLTMAEFYSLLYKQGHENEAEYWYKRLAAYCHPVSKETLIKSLKYRIDNKKENLSIFDCVGYIFALENNMKFVTGDKAFKNKESVLFISK